jgi:hypothetical protein
MNPKRRTVAALSLVALAMLVALGIFRGGPRAHAQDQAPPSVGHSISFGMLGITPGQTARINVANVIAPNDPNYPPGPTRVVLTFLNSEGQVFRGRGGNPIRRSEMLERGQSTFLELNGDDFAINVQWRAVIAVLPPGPIDNAFPPPCVPSVEVINNANGRTAFALSGPPRISQTSPPEPD